MQIHCSLRGILGGPTLWGCAETCKSVWMMISHLYVGIGADRAYGSWYKWNLPQKDDITPRTVFHTNMLCTTNPAIPERCIWQISCDLLHKSDSSLQWGSSNQPVAALHYISLDFQDTQLGSLHWRATRCRKQQKNYVQPINKKIIIIIKWKIK